MLFRRLERVVYQFLSRLFWLMLHNLLRHWFVVNWWKLLWLLNDNRRWWQWLAAWNTHWVAMMNNLMINVFIDFIFKCWNRFTSFLRLTILLISSHGWSERLTFSIFLIVFNLTFLLLIDILRKLLPIKRCNFHLSILLLISAAFIIRLNNIDDIIESMSQLQPTFLRVNMG
jgi:hypothetical protein